MPVTTIVVAETVMRAQNIIVERSLGRSALAVSPRSIGMGTGRGLTGVTQILVDAACWPLDDAVLDALMPSTSSSPVPVEPTMIGADREPTPAEYTQLPVRITGDAVYFGDIKVPGCIAESGITLRPGRDGEFNLLSIEFLVGPVSVEDAFAEEVVLGEPYTVTRYGGKEHPLGGVTQGVSAPPLGA